MPQLDTSTWFIMITSMFLTLFILLQLKISKYNYPHNAEIATKLDYKISTPWMKKWTKIYLPLSLPQ
uniref:ATP synthase complex subunit 8 n=1 Tax=Smutsia temminckii TaxID=302418 RepID=A0A0A0Y3R2_9EUTH|nr:ATP synthase F0 subunit 8 [Smutsia temminckii]AIX03654.1 ATP synthase F0 subunit 8 [Smutsia temminckii]ATE90516.1 ATP synthase F0 subunit 8 [Smutsia temminckii]ATE90529.1 ATP synthase F0 subunit 8 [Smutsia temminckii]ATE90542.1 ATP synthase F0 subunit 8 [Smutsia temminckii]